MCESKNIEDSESRESKIIEITFSHLEEACKFFEKLSLDLRLIGRGFGFYYKMSAQEEINSMISIVPTGDYSEKDVALYIKWLSSEELP